MPDLTLGLWIGLALGALTAWTLLATITLLVIIWIQRPPKPNRSLRIPRRVNWDRKYQDLLRKETK